MKVHVIGFETSEGISKKTGKPYAIGRLYAAIRMAGNETAKGLQGTTYDCDVEIIKKVAHLTPPLNCEVEFEDVIRYGERRQEVVSIVPLDLAKPQKAA